MTQDRRSDSLGLPGTKLLPNYALHSAIIPSIIVSFLIATPWLKANAANICFGARDDSYGNFTIPWSGAVISLRLVHISGYLKCQSDQQPYGSHWGCKRRYKLTTLVTNDMNKVVFPQNYNNNSYFLRRYHINSSELVFNRLSPPLRVAAGQKFRIWYRQDFHDQVENDNAGDACADVYVLMN